MFKQHSDYFKLRPSNGNGCLPILRSFFQRVCHARFTSLQQRMEEGEAINKSQYTYLLTFKWPCPLHNQKNQHTDMHAHIQHCSVCTPNAHIHTQTHVKNAPAPFGKHVWMSHCVSVSVSVYVFVHALPHIYVFVSTNWRANVVFCDEWL